MTDKTPYSHFTLTIELSNADFYTAEGEHCPQCEIARLLRLAAIEIENGCISRILRDTNGNKVGRYYMTLEDETDE